MKVRILQDGPYAEWTGVKCGSMGRAAGEVIDTKDWYGQSLIDSGLAEKYEPIAQPGAPQIIEASRVDKIEAVEPLTMQTIDRPIEPVVRPLETPQKPKRKRTRK